MSSPSAWSAETARVVAAYVYPVKSCGASPVDELVFDRWGGAEGDRRWAVVGADGAVTWQGTHPRLALVHPRLDGDGLLLTAGPGPGPVPAWRRGHSDEHGGRPEAGARHAPLRVVADGPWVDVGLWNDIERRTDVFPCRAAGPDADAWLSAVVGAPLRLVRLGDAALARPHAERLHVISRESAQEVDAWLRARGQPPADEARYRPNLVLAGAEAPLAPFVEDLLASLRWGADAGITVGSRCVRCIVPDVDPSTGRPGEHVLPALAELSARRAPGGPTTLGVYGRGTPGARLARGQDVALEIAF